MDGRGFQFPCEIPIKAMGRSQAAFAEQVTAIVARHAAIDPSRVRLRASGAGRFQSVTIPVALDSRAQLEAIYADLQACEAVLWTL